MTQRRLSRLPLCALLAVLPVSTFAAEPYSLTVGEAKSFNLPFGTVAMKVANPAIAGATILHKDNQWILAGLAPGETQIVARDSSSRALRQWTFRVTAASVGFNSERNQQLLRRAADAQSMRWWMSMGYAQDDERWSP